MFDKKFHFVVTAENAENKYYCYVKTVNNTNNLLSAFAEDAVTVNVCNTKKEAQELADFWNNCYKQNGTYAFN